jgi:hypothetical protein
MPKLKIKEVVVSPSKQKKSLRADSKIKEESDKDFNSIEQLQNSQ